MAVHLVLQEVAMLFPQSGFTSRRFQKRYMQVEAAPCLNQHLVSSFLLILAFLLACWYFLAKLICIFLMINVFVYFFMFLLAIHLSSVVKCPFQTFCVFVNGLYVFLSSSCKSFYFNISWTQIFCQTYVLRIFSSVCGLPTVF